LKTGPFTDSSTLLLIIIFAVAAVLTPLPYFFSESLSTWISEIIDTNIAYLIIVAIWILAATIVMAIVTRNKSIQKIAMVKIADLSKAAQASEASNIELREKLLKSASQVEDLERTNNSLSATIERLQTNEKLQREFVDIAAHEIRTPVQPILGMADLLEVQIEGKEKIEISKAEVELISRNAKRLEHLTSDMLQVARIESGMFKINKDRLSLDDLIYNAIIDAKSQLRAVDNEIKILYEPSGNFIIADKDKLTEVIHNLLSNAVKFTESGTIAIESQITISNNDAEDSNLLVRVKDTGDGIDPEILPYMFTKFVTKSDSGTGLGLYIARKIIEAHDGKIWGENNEDGKGATFSFSLPIEEQCEQTRG
jgi:signal transduction histidine kinase